MRRPLSALLAAGVLAATPAVVAAAPVPPAAPAAGCEVESATLEWGFKESFRAYIDSSIANGEWTVADGATYQTPVFAFPGGSGRLDPGDPSGSIGFAGSVRFTGHGGVLDTTLANPVLAFQGDARALLRLDVSGPTMMGDQIEVAATPFVEVDLAGQDLTVVDGVVTIVEAPTSLTADGETAFPNYPAGEEFDPISATIDLGDCELPGRPIGTGGTADLPRVIAAVAAGFAVVAAAFVTVVRMRRRRP